MINGTLEFHETSDITFTKFCEKYFPSLVLIVNCGVSKEEIRKIIKNIISMQTDFTKNNLMIEMPKRNTERKLVNWLSQAVELYRPKEELK